MQLVRRIDGLNPTTCQAVLKRSARLHAATDLAPYLDALCEEEDATASLDDMRRLLAQIRPRLPDRGAV